MKSTKLDKQIEQAWYRHASGVQVDIMDLSSIYRDVRAALAGGGELDAAVIAAIAKYRKN